MAYLPPRISRSGCREYQRTTISRLSTGNASVSKMVEGVGFEPTNP